MLKNRQRSENTNMAKTYGAVRERERERERERAIL